MAATQCIAMRNPDNLKQWLDTPRGRLVLRWERELLARLWTRFYGHTALVIGSWGEHLPPFPARWRVETVGHDPELHSSALTDLRHLPLLDDSADLVILRHSLAFAPSPHQLLREADRVLSARGQMVILGLSPWSLWGMAARLPVRRLQMPDGVQRLGRTRLLDWLNLLNFRVEEDGHYGPQVPLWLHRAHIDGLFQPGYFIQARKQRAPVRPLWADARASRPVFGAVAMPSARSAARVIEFPGRGKT